MRSMQEKDLEMVLGWRNCDWVRSNMYTDHIITWEEHFSWFEHAKKSTNSVFLICEQNGVPIGVINFVNIDKKNSKAFWGFYLGEEKGAPGRGPAMEYLALEYAFSELKLHKLCCEVFTFNLSVVNLHKKFGFVEEGRYRDHFIKNGKYEDVVALAMFEEDWDLIREKMEKICFRSRQVTSS